MSVHEYLLHRYSYSPEPELATDFLPNYRFHGSCEKCRRARTNLSNCKLSNLCLTVWFWRRFITSPLLLNQHQTFDYISKIRKASTMMVFALKIPCWSFYQSGKDFQVKLQEARTRIVTITQASVNRVTIWRSESATRCIISIIYFDFLNILALAYELHSCLKSRWREFVARVNKTACSSRSQCTY